MEIRLAYNQGLLSQRSLNPFQKFAATYHAYMERRVHLQDTEDVLQRQTWYLAPARYADLFLDPFVPEPLTMAGEPIEEVDDIDMLDAYFNDLENRKSMTGAQLIAAMDEDGWV